MTTRNEHLAWCKQRAREYLDHSDAQNALASMLSDLGKHPETKEHIGIQLGLGLMMAGQLSTVQQVRDFVEGFN